MLPEIKGVTLTFVYMEKALKKCSAKTGDVVFTFLG